jgi:hypothetical protein
MAKSLPLNLFGSEPLLKTTGIAIVLAGVLEDDGKKEEAYKVYKEAQVSICSRKVKSSSISLQVEFYGV